MKIATAAGTVGAVVIALSQKWWSRKIYHPTLKISSATKPPYCVKIPCVVTELVPRNDGIHLGQLESASYYLRVKVMNSGNETARNVELYARELRQEKEDGRWRPIEGFPPMNLIWSNSTPPTGTHPLLAPGASRYCDISHVLDPEKRKLIRGEDRPDLNLSEGEVSLTFDLTQKPLHLGYIVEKGHYRLAVEIAADNFAAATTDVEIRFDGEWTSDQEEMFGRHLSIRA